MICGTCNQLCVPCHGLKGGGPHVAPVLCPCDTHSTRGLARFLPRCAAAGLSTSPSLLSCLVCPPLSFPCRTQPHRQYARPATATWALLRMGPASRRAATADHCSAIICLKARAGGALSPISNLVAQHARAVHQMVNNHRKRASTHLFLLSFHFFP